MSWEELGKTQIKIDPSQNAVQLSGSILAEAQALPTKIIGNKESKTFGQGKRMHLLSDVEALSIPTYDSNPEVTHPSVLYFPNSWKGYKWWMAFTPYPDNTRENPSIVVSNDAENWVVPDGLTNPIEPKPVDGYNSDPELVHVKETDKVRCYWRSHQNSTPILKYKESADGISWSDTVICTVTSGIDFKSPAIIVHNSPTYHDTKPEWFMWAVDNNYRLKMWESADGSAWRHKANCWFDGVDRQGLIYHHCVWVSETEYRMLVHVSPTLGTEPYTAGRVYYATSRNGIEWYIDNSPVVSAESIFNWHTYRPFGVPIGDIVKLFVSGTSVDGTANGYWQIGTTDAYITPKDILPNNRSEIIEQHLNVDKHLASRYLNYGVNVSGSAQVRALNVSDYKQITILIENNYDVDITFGTIQGYAQYGGNANDRKIFSKSLNTAVAAGATLLLTTTEVPELNLPIKGLSFYIDGGATLPTSGTLNVTIMGVRK